jgi:hypothetical protein
MIDAKEARRISAIRQISAILEEIQKSSFCGYTNIIIFDALFPNTVESLKNWGFSVNSVDNKTYVRWDKPHGQFAKHLNEAANTCLFNHIDFTPSEDLLDVLYEIQSRAAIGLTFIRDTTMSEEDAKTLQKLGYIVRKEETTLGYAVSWAQGT